MLNAATFSGKPVNEQQARKLIEQGGALLEGARSLAGH
jgi:hypothetical protein